MKDSPKILNEFISHMTVIKGRSPKTAEQYVIDIKMFLRFIVAFREKIDLNEVSLSSIDISYINIEFMSGIKREEVYEFLKHIAENRNNATKTRARKLSSLKSFYRYLTVTMKYFEDNPASEVDAPPVKNALPKFLTIEESVLLLKTVREDENSANRERDYAIITLFLNCGIRLSELVGINLNDIDRELRSMRVLGKGSKERIIYLNNACRAAVTDYLKIRAKNAAIIDKNALFLSNRQRRISIKTVQWMVYKYLDAAGLGHKHYSVHKLRHTAATLMYQTGDVDVRVLKDILGHEQLNTTQIYTHVSDSQMEKAMKKNPLSNITPPKTDENLERKEDDNDD